MAAHLLQDEDINGNNLPYDDQNERISYMGAYYLYSFNNYPV